MTMTLDAHSFDFIERFPVPNDEQLNEAGRQGMLDQKEDPDMGDAEWIAQQHAVWALELATIEAGIGYLTWLIERGIDPATGRPPRANRQQALIEALRVEQRDLRDRRDGVLGDYADHFGERAASAFADFVAATPLDIVQALETQGELFD